MTFRMLQASMESNSRGNYDENARELEEESDFDSEESGTSEVEDSD